MRGGTLGNQWNICNSTGEDYTTGFGLEWTIEASERMKKFIVNNNNQQLIDYQSQDRAFNMAVQDQFNHQIAKARTSSRLNPAIEKL